jgi:hypothetical protein
MTITYFDKVSGTQISDSDIYPQECKVPPPNHAQRVMAEMLDDAKGKVCGDRHDSYGPPIDNHSRTAEGINWYLKHCGPNIDARDICLMNVIQKISRDLHCRRADNLTDIVGFAANAAACHAAELPANGT